MRSIRGGVSELSFKDTYIPQDKDLCARRVGEDRFEVSVWRGDLPDGGWYDQRVCTTVELNKFVRSQKFLGKHGEWEYYRPGEK